MKASNSETTFEILVDNGAFDVRRSAFRKSVIRQLKSFLGTVDPKTGVLTRMNSFTVSQAFLSKSLNKYS